MTDGPKLSAIRQIAITVADVDIALGFYRDVLGLPFLFRAGPGLAFLDAGGIRLMLSTPQGAGAVGANSTLNIDAVVSDGGINYSGAGTLNLSAANTFAGGFTHSAGKRWMSSSTTIFLAAS